ncbi:hypothetical protein VUR80DRAFT_4843 [Thermomyces stellatus]
MPPLMSARLRTDILTFFADALTIFETRRLPFSLLCTVSEPSLSPPRPLASKPKPPVERLVILDSSFNPPTVAHRRMVLSAVETYHEAAAATAEEEGERPARGGREAAAAAAAAPRGSVRVLLLLSVNNADKAPQPASFPHRLAMMYLFAKDLVRDVARGLEVDIALSSQPYFHSKCELIARAGGEYYTAPEAMEQVFLAGYDTLIRIFDPRYYSAGRTMEDSLGPFFERARLRVALRTGDRWGEAEEQREYLVGLKDGGLEKVGGKGEWVARVELVPGHEEGEGVSSTAVRRAVGEGDEGSLGRLLGDGVREWVLAEALYKEEA